MVDNFNFWLETIELCDHYTSYGIECDFLGIPTWNQKDVEKCSNSIYKKYESKINISYIGPARNEKKFNDFANAINQLSKTEDSQHLTGINKVFVSITEPKKGYSKEVKDGIDLLNGIKNLCIELCKENLTREDYIKQIRKSHLVWLAYDQQAYANGRGSGILVDCLASGTCFIARSGTTPQYYLRGNGFVIDNYMHCSEKIKQFLNEKQVSSKASLKMQQHFSRNYSSELLVKKLGIEDDLFDHINAVSKAGTNWNLNSN